MNYNGQLRGFPTEIVEKMLENQEIQGNPRNITVFEEHKLRGGERGGFTWEDTVEGHIFWRQVISYLNFSVFFERYPKKIEKTLPRVMMTWNGNNTPKPRLIFAIKNSYYFTWGLNIANEEDAELASTVYKFNNAKELFDEEIPFN
jgi:hypothetical protein